MNSSDRITKALLADFQTKTALPKLDVFEDKKIENLLASTNRDDHPRRPLIVDSEPPIHYDTSALKKISIVRQEFLKGVMPAKAFHPVRRLMARLAAEDKGDDLEVDVWEVEPRGGQSIGSPSHSSLGHVGFSCDMDPHDRRPQTSSDQGLHLEPVGPKNKQ